MLRSRTLHRAPGASKCRQMQGQLKIQCHNARKTLASDYVQRGAQLLQLAGTGGLEDNSQHALDQQAEPQAAWEQCLHTKQVAVSVQAAAWQMITRGGERRSERRWISERRSRRRAAAAGAPGCGSGQWVPVGLCEADLPDHLEVLEERLGWPGGQSAAGGDGAAVEYMLVHAQFFASGHALGQRRAAAGSERVHRRASRDVAAAQGTLGRRRARTLAGLGAPARRPWMRSSKLRAG